MPPSVSVKSTVHALSVDNPMRSWFPGLLATTPPTSASTTDLQKRAIVTESATFPLTVQDPPLLWSDTVWLGPTIRIWLTPVSSKPSRSDARPPSSSAAPPPPRLESSPEPSQTITKMPSTTKMLFSVFSLMRVRLSSVFQLASVVR